MASAIHSETARLIDEWPTVVHAIFNVSLFILVLTVIIFIYVILLRVRNNILARYKTRFKQHWRRIIFDWMSGTKIEPAELGRRDQLLLMELWRDLRRLIDDDSAEAINDFARTFHLDETAAGILQYRSYNSEHKKIWLQLQAIDVARALHTEAAVAALLRASDSSNFQVNVAATCALVELHHERADLSVLSSLMQFHHWVPYIVARVSRAGGSDILHLVGEQMDYMDDQQARNLISLTEASDDRSLLPLLIDILHKTTDIQEQASILRALERLGDHSHVKYILPYLQDEEPVLRLRAVSALGKLGDVNDLKQILPLCSDEHWWVRYRAAESYLQISRPDSEGFSRLLNSLMDTPAGEMFNHVYAEMNNA